MSLVFAASSLSFAFLSVLSANEAFIELIRDIFASTAALFYSFLSSRSLRTSYFFKAIWSFLAAALFLIIANLLSVTLAARANLASIATNFASFASS